MINPISDAVSDKRWWRENLGTLSLDQVISMIDNGQSLPWRRPRMIFSITPTSSRVASDWEELSFQFKATGMIDRNLADTNFESDLDDLEDFPFDISTRNWFRFHNKNMLWVTEDDRRQIGFRIVRNKA